MQRIKIGDVMELWIVELIGVVKMDSFEGLIT